MMCESLWTTALHMKTLISNRGNSDFRNDYIGNKNGTAKWQLSQHTAKPTEGTTSPSLSILSSCPHQSPRNPFTTVVHIPNSTLQEDNLCPLSPLPLYIAIDIYTYIQVYVYIYMLWGNCQACMCTVSIHTLLIWVWGLVYSLRGWIGNIFYKG